MGVAHSSCCKLLTTLTTLTYLHMSIIMALTWSERNYCAWFDDTICEEPALVCHGSQSRFHRPGVTCSSPHMNLFSTCTNLKSN